MDTQETPAIRKCARDTSVAQASNLLGKFRLVVVGQEEEVVLDVVRIACSPDRKPQDTVEFVLDHSGDVNDCIH